MSRIQFVREPGYLFDLFGLFVMYFNRQHCMDNFVDENKPAEDYTYFEELLTDFGSVSEELRVFFQLRNDGVSFLSTCYYAVNKDVFLLEQYDLIKVQMALSDHASVVKKVRDFYFGNQDEKVVNMQTTSLNVISRLIFESQYSSEMKNSLYAFFIEPEPIIQKLSNELLEKEHWLAQVYERNREKLYELENEFDIELYKRFQEKVHDMKANAEDYEDIYVSFSICNINLIREVFYEKEMLLQLGRDYQNSMNSMMTSNGIPKLDSFGYAIEEPNRIRILDYIYKNGEVGIKEIEKELGFTGPNAYYHVSLMMKTGILKGKNRGRIILYSVNSKYFQEMCNLLSRYC